ncbi:MAG: small ribosomal subunit Rsm22 family protein [Herpetosiphon sp.]
MQETAHPVPGMPDPNMIALPSDLQAAIAHELSRVAAPRWLASAQAISQRYRGPRTDNGSMPQLGRDEALGYTAIIMPATYAQLHGAMAATAARLPDWQPQTMLDLGSGPGTALWAATHCWPSLTRLGAVERAAALIELGQSLAHRATNAAVRQAHWQATDLARYDPPPEQRYDLVVIGHVMNELEPALRSAIVALAWRLTSGVLLLVEPGTSEAFPFVRGARDELLAVGAHTIAPCTHDLPCPLLAEWCHFPQRLRRPPFQQRARSAPSDWEDAKYCYAALARFAPPAHAWGRVIREPTSNKAYAEALISTAAGVHRYRALKRHPNAYRFVRKLHWGAAQEAPLPEPNTAILVAEQRST